jgi:hypothetical protein
MDAIQNVKAKKSIGRHGCRWESILKLILKRGVIPIQPTEDMIK